MGRRVLSSAEKLDAIISKIGEHELRRYYHFIREGVITTRPHNYLLVIIAEVTKSFNEWLNGLKTVLSPIASVTSGKKMYVNFQPIPCSCGYDRTTRTEGLLTESGTPLPYPVCPAGVLTFQTIGRVNKNVIISEKEINDPKATIVKLNDIYIAYSDKVLPGIVIHRKVDAGGRYQPIERSIY